jgi:adenylate kinase
LFLIVLGPPGAGKGTQAALLAEKWGLAHIATGDMFREVMRSGSELGRQAKAYYDRGELVPDELTIRMLLERLAQPDCAFAQTGAPRQEPVRARPGGCVLDGFPRNLEQARALDSALAERGQAVDRVAYIRVGEEELMGRLGGRWTCRQCGAVYHQRNNPPAAAGRCDQCGGELHQRSDDRPETVRHRLAVYFRDTAPVVEYYRQRGKLVEVNGEQDIEAVSRALAQALEPATSAR